MHHGNYRSPSKPRLTDQQRIILDIINAGTSDLSEIQEKAALVDISELDTYRACRYLRQNGFCNGEKRPNPNTTSTRKADYIWAYIPKNARQKALEGASYEVMRKILFGDGPEAANPDVPNTSAVERLILQALDYPRTLAEVVEVCGYPENIIRDALDRMTGRGVLKAMRTGKLGTTWSVIGA